MVLSSVPHGYILTKIKKEFQRRPQKNGSAYTDALLQEPDFRCTACLEEHEELTAAVPGQCSLNQPGPHKYPKQWPMHSPCWVSRLLCWVLRRSRNMACELRVASCCDCHSGWHSAPGLLTGRLNQSKLLNFRSLR